MSAPRNFRRAWLSWFVCPRCQHQSLFPHLKAEIGADRSTIAIVYRCESCGGLAKRRRQWLAPSLSLAFGVLALLLIYHALLGGVTIGAVLWVLSILIAMYLINLVLERLTNEYVVSEAE